MNTKGLALPSFFKRLKIDAFTQFLNFYVFIIDDVKKKERRGKNPKKKNKEFYKKSLNMEMLVPVDDYMLFR